MVKKLETDHPPHTRTHPSRLVPLSSTQSIINGIGYVQKMVINQLDNQNVDTTLKRRRCTEVIMASYAYTTILTNIPD